MTEEIRPICLYVETCLDRKEGTRDCAKCEHHFNYWTEVMIRDMEKNIKRLEQENKELKEINIALIQEAEDVAEARMEICNQCGNRDDYNIPCKMIRDLDYGLNITIEERDNYRSALEEIREIAEPRFVNGLNEEADQYNQCMDRIQNKINECIGTEAKKKGESPVTH